MATLKAKKIRTALQKVRNVGRAEESVIVDGCTIVLQSMSPDSYDAILKEVDDLDKSEYLHALQLGYLSRSTVEIEGVDLREVDFVEEDAPTGSYVVNAVVPTEAKAKRIKEELAKLGIDLTIIPPSDSEESRVVLLERHEWLRKQFSTWSQEAISVAFRKYADVVVVGETRAREKVEFKTPDETDEDKFRRLLVEAKALEDKLPAELLASILAESGYLQKASTAELDTVDKHLRGIEDTEAKPLYVEPEESEEQAQETTPVVSSEELARRVRERTPLNRSPEILPQQTQQPQINPNSRAAQIAALEGLSVTDPSIENYPTLGNSSEIPEIIKRAPIDGDGARRIIDAPPVVGLNPRFRPPQRP